MAVDTKLTDLGTATTFSAGSWFLLVDPAVTTMDDSGTDLKVQAGNLIKGLLPSQAGNANKILSTDGAGALSWATAATGSGTVTTVSVASANGFTGTVANATTTPAITITTSITGILKGNGTAISAATSGTDYEPPIAAGSTAQYLKGDKSLGTLNQAAVAGLTTASSPAFAGLTVGTLGGLLKATSGVVSAATAGTDYLTTSYAGTSSITAVGTITSGTWTGTTIAIANGGTGQTTAANAINALLPSQAGKSGQFLSTNGTVAAWGSPSGAGTVTSVSVASANGLAGTVATATSTPAITLSTTVTGIVKGDGTSFSAATLGTDYSRLLAPTAVKTAGYTAAAWDFVPCDSTSGGFTVTLPPAPADRTLVGVKHTNQGSTNAITVACGGSDVFNRTSGPTSLSLSSLGRGVQCQYQSSTGIWFVINRDVGTILNADLTAPGSDGQFLRNTAGVITGSTRLLAGSGNSINFVPTADPGTPAVGDLWVDSTQKAPSFLTGGVIARAGGIIWQALSAGTAVANTTSQASILSGVTALGTLTIPANSLVAGKCITFHLLGSIATSGTPTIQVVFLLGATAIATSAATSVTAASASGFYLSSRLGGYQVQSIGASGSVIGMSEATQPGVFGANLPSGSSGNLAPVAVTIDTTAALTIDIQVKWSAASASNTVQLKGGWIKIDG